LFSNEKPAIDWQSRVFLEIYSIVSEWMTHDARRRGTAVPNPDGPGLETLRRPRWREYQFHWNAT
jgi:hypothetical protein